MKRNRKKAYRWGHIAELQAMFWLLLKGYTIVAWRHRNAGGEVDIIAQHGDILIFTEVKARKSSADAILSITPDKQRRLHRAAEHFIATHQKYACHHLRFDVMMVTSWWKIIHQKDAWRV